MKPDRGRNGVVQGREGFRDGGREGGKGDGEREGGRKRRWREGGKKREEAGEKERERM